MEKEILWILTDLPVQCPKYVECPSGESFHVEWLFLLLLCRRNITISCWLCISQSGGWINSKLFMGRRSRRRRRRIRRRELKLNFVLGTYSRMKCKQWRGPCKLTDRDIYRGTSSRKLAYYYLLKYLNCISYCHNILMYLIYS